MNLTNQQNTLLQALTNTMIPVSERLKLVRTASMETIKKQGFQTVNIKNYNGENVRFDFDRVAPDLYKLERQTDSMEWRKLSGFISFNE